MTETYLWHLWPARNWPASAREEKAVVNDLIKRSTSTALSFERGDITAVLNILRLGLSIDEVLPVAPGLNFDRMLGAYNYLAEQRATAANSFAHIVRHHAKADVSKYAEASSRLVPVPTYRAVTAIRKYENSPQTREDYKELITTIDQVKIMVSQSTELAHETEVNLAAIAKAATTDEEKLIAIRMGRKLYDPYSDCLWSAQFYMPRRLTDLVPGRIADLLEEAEA